MIGSAGTACGGTSVQEEEIILDILRNMQLFKKCLFYGK
jgi:hypothetical protein